MPEATASATSQSSTLSTPHPDLIAQRAQALWEQAGRPEGRALEHWLEAERQLQNSARPASALAPAPTPASRETKPSAKQAAKPVAKQAEKSMPTKKPVAKTSVRAASGTGAVASSKPRR